MDKKKAFDSSSQWISDEQRIHETSDYGRNKAAVTEALTEQQRRVKLVNEYSKDVAKAKAAAKSSSASSQVESAYGELKEVAGHRLGCLQDIAQIASLEDVFNMMSIEFAQRATSLVVDACTEATSSKKQEEEAAEAGSDGIARAAQSCILAVRNNWNWISKLVKCADVHLKHVSEYHQFFHEGKEYDKWMPSELNKHITTLENIKPDENDGQKLLILLKETLAVFLHWQNKINTLFEKSRKIVPVHFRTKPLDHYRPVTSLCDYKTNEIDIQEGEELTLIDNSKPQIWLVRNMHATESRVPSVICVIPGPDTDAVSMATRLRIQLLKTWTVCLKNLGRVVIMYFSLILGQLDDNTSKRLRCLSDDDKMRTIQTLQWIVDVFSKYWSEDPRYQNLYSSIMSNRDTVRQQGNPKDYDSSFNREYITRIRSMEDILTHFKNYLRQWETYKLISESSQHTDQMLLMENWETLKYFSTEEVIRKVNLALEEGSSGSGEQEAKISHGCVYTETTMSMPELNNTTEEEETTETIDGMEETVEEIHSTVTETQVTSSSEVRTEMTDEYEREHQSAETEQLMHAEQEERKKFVITDLDINTAREEATSTPDVMTSSPRQPEDGIDLNSNFNQQSTKFNGNKDKSNSPTAKKNSEAFLDQTLIHRMTSTNDTNTSHISEITNMTNKIISMQSKKNENKKSSVAVKTPTSPSTNSRIPVFKSSTTNIPSIQHRSSSVQQSKDSKLERAVSLDHLSHTSDDKEFDYGKSKLPSSLSITNISTTSSKSSSYESGRSSTETKNITISENNLKTSHSSSKRGNSDQVLIYTEETVSHIPLPVKSVESHTPVATPLEVKMCSVGTQYEQHNELDGSRTLTSISIVSSKFEIEKKEYDQSSNSTLFDKDNIGLNNEKRGIITSTDDENKQSTTLHITKDQSNIISTCDETDGATTFTTQSSISSVPEKESSKIPQLSSTTITSRKKSRKERKKERKQENNSKGIIVKATSQSTKTSSLTNDKELEMDLDSQSKSSTTLSLDVQKNVTTTSSFNINQSADLEDEYQLASEPTGMEARSSCRQRREVRGSSSSKAGGTIQMLREYPTENKDELQLLQQAISALSAAPGIETTEGDGAKRSALCLRICKACLPLQVLMLMLLGLACLFPMSEEEYSCTLSNNFEDSLDVMLKHKNGPPPF